MAKSAPSKDNPTDLQAALRKACEEAAKDICNQIGGSWELAANDIDRHLTPVFEALRNSVIEECAKVQCRYCASGDKVHEGYMWGQKTFVHTVPLSGNPTCTEPCEARKILALKGAPR